MLVQITLIGIRQAQLHGEFGVGVRRKRDAVALARDPFPRADEGNFGVVEHVRPFGDRDPVDGHLLGHDHARKVVRPLFGSQVGDAETQRIQTRPLGIVAELDFGLVATLDVEIRLGVEGVENIGKPRALFAGGIRIAVLVLCNGRRRHHKTVQQFVDLHFIEVGIAFDEVLTNERRNARDIGRRHGSAAVNAVTAEHRRGDIAAVRRDIGVELQIGRGAPGREIAHERTGFIIGRKLDRPFELPDELACDIRRDRTGGDFVARAERRVDNARNVVVDDTADRAVACGDLLLVFEARRAAFDDGDIIA